MTDTRGAEGSLGSVRRRRIHPERAPIAAALDAASVVLFVGIGRRNHDEDPGLAGIVDTAAPFLFALAFVWVAISAWNRPTTIPTGVIVWLGTVAVGMVLRRLVFDEGTAMSFVIVATAFLGVFLVGWRAVWLVVDRRASTAT